MTAMTMTLAERTRLIKRHAIDAGFSLVGIAEAVPLEQEMERFSEWLARGYHATMGYMERNQEKRRDVREILPDTRSVIVVAHNYYTPAQHAQHDSSANAAATPHGKISRYAWGDDYHDVLPPKLETLAAHVRELVPQAHTKVYTDTGAILVYQWAIRAGIGWQGKHSNIISRSFGSWFFLGIVLTTAEFLYDAPVADFCGTCTACMQACPTQAIVQPYQVDARKCIPFWTIETKPHVDFPTDVAEHLDEWLFGCDTCQDVCPWNRFQQPTSEERFQPRNGETTLPLDAVQSMSQEEFSARFRKSPIKRTKMAGLKRNAQALNQSSTHQSSTHQGSTDPNNT
jgi:epoxyqueuosine reductase